jgi:Domain of unknown function (DUF4419)
MIRFLVLILCVPAMLLSAEPPAPRIFILDGSLKKASTPLAAVTATEILKRVGNDRFEASADAGDQQWLDHDPSRSEHPVVMAAQLAFAEHRPLVLSPDIIWLLITQMAAREVLARPDQYRSILVTHQEGQRTLQVRRDEFILGDLRNDWPGVFAEFEQQITDRSPDPLPKIFAHPFTTSEVHEVATRRVTLMKALSPFYRYEVGTLCGIPEIHLYGTISDWSWIRDQSHDFAKLGMEKRMQALAPVLEQFVAAAEGRIDVDFWRSFYKFTSMSGGDITSGWINLFFLASEDGVAARPVSWSKHRDSDSQDMQIGAGPYNLKEVPPAWVEQEFLWQYQGQPLPMALRAGFLGVEQDPRTLALRPRLGWQVFQTRESPAQRAVRAYLSEQEDLVGTARGLAYDPQFRSLRVVPEGAKEQLPMEGWLLALPMMINLQNVDVMDAMPGVRYQIDDQRTFTNQEFCRQLLALPRIKQVHVPKSISSECLRILRDRTDWKFEQSMY